MFAFGLDNTHSYGEFWMISKTNAADPLGISAFSYVAAEVLDCLKYF